MADTEIYVLGALKSGLHRHLGKNGQKLYISGGNQANMVATILFPLICNLNQSYCLLHIYSNLESTLIWVSLRHASGMFMALFHLSTNQHSLKGPSPLSSNLGDLDSEISILWVQNEGIGIPKVVFGCKRRLQTYLKQF